jgi:outer membrane protein OmpA-like peptidoglycan-associated protein
MVRDMRGRWSKPSRLPEPVNLPGYTATQPNVGVDTVTRQPYLFFASDRPGGRGKLDVWAVPLDTLWFCPCNRPVNGQKGLRLPAFDPPANLQAVNTPDNDATPFFHTPAQTLYLSSDGRRGFGGYDVYRADYRSGRYQEPQNAGFGINSSYNDVYFALRPDGNSGYVSSNRPGSFYLDESNKACCNDLFTLQRADAPRDTLPKPNANAGKLPGNERPMRTVPIPQLPTPDPIPQLADFVGLPLYFDNDEPDKRTRRTTTQKTYEETALPYLDRIDAYREAFSAGLNDDARDRAEAQIDAFFENDVRRGYERLNQLCEVLETRLRAGETVEVVIKGFTSPRAQSDYNVNLGKRRISSVRNHIEAYGNGALRPYVQNGALRITEASFGETKAQSGISDRLDDERNSIYNPDAARERRVEIVEIRQ